jgi:hypothetical protein
MIKIIVFLLFTTLIIAGSSGLDIEADYSYDIDVSGPFPDYKFYLVQKYFS